MTPATKDPLQQWAQHNPFERASAELIKQVQKALKQQRKLEGEPALF